MKEEDRRSFKNIYIIVEKLKKYMVLIVGFKLEVLEKY